MRSLHLKSVGIYECATCTSCPVGSRSYALRSGQLCTPCASVVADIVRTVPPSRRGHSSVAARRGAHITLRMKVGGATLATTAHDDRFRARLPADRRKANGTNSVVAQRASGHSPRWNISPCALRLVPRCAICCLASQRVPRRTTWRSLSRHSSQRPE